MILTHGLNSIPRYQQTWTNMNVPDGVQLLHDFGDGPKPAVPYDNCGVSNSVVFTEVKPYYNDNCGVSNNVISVEIITI